VITLFEYQTVKNADSAEITEKKSRFTARVAPVSSERDALAFLNRIRASHREASHNVYAYILRENHIQRYSDDGEPSGTAGLPTLDAIRGAGLTDVCIVTTRYFGGTLLGAGGLARAYAKAAKLGVDAAGIVRRVLCYEYTVKTDYNLLGRIRNAAAALSCIAGEIAYTETVCANYFVPYTVLDFTEKITDAASGRVTVTKKDEGRYIDAD
jgi:uncharacterized YigZ family protein